MRKNQIDISLDNGKYRIVMYPSGKFEALRYGESWRNLTGDNLVYFLAKKIQELEAKLIGD